ncbi:winged helix-turn-helix transcriptional regulator [Roseinatronobacter alkalisoli]|uniref:Helix-turn-helix domain-containing protein n=1 Tax=Roseinatronobacter alkalisoli TaxID=3028235 RepID=A0ABT5TD31_9RHOB|nr:helix-turn-helix domain-containing protein [Roseinatronobacter sp. HJB301]MDD7973033.1 helix-turn-helix domain-containing protein [Roseinatronobacter sp. HJB301]
MVDVKNAGSAQGPLKAGCLWREVFNHVTSRWGFLILIALVDKPLRFYVLRNSVEGISEKMLSQTVKLLMRDGLVSRHVEETIPPQVSYALTDMGHEIAGRLDCVSKWIGDHVTHIEQAQDRFDRRVP